MDVPTLLVAVETPSLLRVIEHLLKNREDLTLATFTGKTHQLPEQAARHRPAVIVAEHRLLGQDAARTVRTIRDVHPNVKLILIDSFDWRHADPRDFLADICLNKSNVVRSLVRTVQDLVRAGERQRKE